MTRKYIELDGIPQAYKYGECHTNGEDASAKLIWYKDGDMEAVRAFSVDTIDCVVGRVKIGKWWGIVDRSLGPLWISVYDIQEPEYESEDNLSISYCL